MNLGVVILNYNNFLDTLTCVRSLYDLLPSDSPDGAFLRIVVVDNDSDNDSAVHIAEWMDSHDHYGYIDFSLVKARENNGYAAGNNLGLAIVFDSLHCDAAVIVNNDTQFITFDLEMVLKQLAEGQSDVWCAHLISNNGGLVREECVGVFSYATFGSSLCCLGSVGPGRKILGEFYVSGAFFGLTREIYYAVGPLCEDFFLYLEEEEWFVRARRKMHRELRVSEFKCVSLLHKVGGSTGNTSDGARKSVIAEYYSARAKLLFAKKRSWILLPIAILRNLVMILERLAKGFHENAYAIFCATLRGLVGESGRSIVPSIISSSYAGRSARTKSNYR